MARTVMEYAWGDRNVKVTNLEHGDPVRRMVEIRSGQSGSLVAELGPGAPFFNVVRIEPSPSAPSLLIAAARPAEGPRVAPTGSEASPPTDRAWSSGTTMLWWSGPGSDLLAPGSLDGIREVVALRDQVSAVAGQVQAELAGRAATIGRLGPEFEAGFRDAAATHDALVETLGVTSGSRDAPPDVAAVREALGRMRQRPGQADLAHRLQVELAARAFLEGHPAEARRLLPWRNDPGADPDHAAAVLRDMQALVAGTGDFGTWPAQEAVKEDGRPGTPQPRGPPVVGLSLLLPEAPVGPVPSTSGGDVTAGLSPLPATAPPPRFVFAAELRPVPPPIAAEVERVKSSLRAHFPHQSARIRRRLNAAGREPIDPPGADEDAETLLARIELHLELLARAAESIRPDALASPAFQGMPTWYPHLAASYLRIPLTRTECDLIAGLDRKGTPIAAIADRVARARVDALAGLLPRLVDASKSVSYARLPELHHKCLEVLADLDDDDFLRRVREFVRPEETPHDGDADEAARAGDREGPSEPSEAARARLMRVLTNPYILYKDAPESLPDTPELALFKMLGGIPTVLREVDREGRLPEAGRWTEPLLALIAKARRAARHPGAPRRD